MTIQELEETGPMIGWFDVRSQLRQHLYTRAEKTFARGDADRDAITNLAAVRRRQRAIRRTFLQGIGGLPRGDASLDARVVGEVRGNGFRVEKIIFTSRPNTFITANLYLPDKLRSRNAAVLFVSGHHERAKHETEYQNVCQTLVKAGLIVLAQDPIGQGERFSYHDSARQEMHVRWGTREHEYAGLQCLPLGDAIARYFLHDAMRGIDYLISRPEVDRHRIGVTGNSGGGTQTCLMMLGDPRIAAAAPATFIMSRRSYMWCGQAQDAEQIWPGFSAGGFDHEDVLLSMAPKPVRVLAVTSDFFPIEGTRSTVERCKRIWKACGKAADVDLVEDQTTHTYTPTLSRAAAEFFARHLMGKKIGAKPVRTTPFESSKLWCTQSGQVRGEIAGAKAVWEENRDRAKELTGNGTPSQKEALSWLRRRVFSHRNRCDLNPRFHEKREMDGLAVDCAFWWSQEGILNTGMLFHTKSKSPRRLPVTLVVWDNGCASLRPHETWIRKQCRAGRAVLVLDVTGGGSLLPNSLTGADPLGPFGAIHKLQDDCLWLDDDLAAMRTYDVIRALDVIGEWPNLDPRNFRVYAHGKQGVYAQLAAALDPRIKSLEVKAGIGSFAKLVGTRFYDPTHAKAIVIRGILNHCDLPDLMRWTRASGTKVS